MTHIFSSQNARCRSPLGAVRRGEAVTFTLFVPHAMGCHTPKLLFKKDGDERFALHDMQREGDEDGCGVFSVSVTPGETGLYFYYFDLYVNFQKLFRGPLGEAVLTAGEGEAYQLTVYDDDFATPDALCGGVYYQIFPDRFCEGNSHEVMPFADRIYRTEKDGEPYFWPNEIGGDLNMDYFGGDLRGIRDKLDYLARMGVTLIYLNPIFEAHSNHRYNTANYMRVDPLLGSNAEFRTLCREAKSHGIGVILDGVFSHTGSDSVYFNREGRYPTPGAYNDPKSPYRSWYDFSPRYTCGYRSWWGFESLPEVNENEPSYREFICGEGGVIDYWLGLGAAGFRLDVADELPDDFIEEIRRAVKRHGEDKLLLGEVWEDASNKWSYGKRRRYLLGRGLDSVMNYPFRTAILDFVRGGDARAAADAVLRVCEHYPAPALRLLMNFVSTHDTVRAITAIAGESCEGKDRYWQSGRRLSEEQYEYGRRKLVLAYALAYTLPGMPCVYYGDEIGMQGYKDPFNRAFFDWHSKERRIRPVLQKLAALRKRCAAFKEGALRVTRAEGGILQFVREGGGEAAEICINRNANDIDTVLLGEAVTVPAYDFAVRCSTGEALP